MTPMELRQQGLTALHRELGYVGMIRFLHQFEQGGGNYTQERHQWQDGLTVAHLVTQMQGRRTQGKETER